MRALWSRAVQNPGTCRCVSCVSNATAVARRCGHSALRGSWTFGTPTSTLLYTAVFAAGLTVDAKAKLKRNRQWDEAFKQLRAAIDRPPSTPTIPNKTAEPVEEAVADSARRVARMDVGDDAVLPERAVAQLDAEARAWDELRFDSRMPGAERLAWPANTGRDLMPHHLPPQSLWAPDVLRLTATRRRHTRKKVAMQELATGLLIHNLLRHSGLGQYSDNLHGQSLFERLCPHIREVTSSTHIQSQTARRNFLVDMERLHLTDVSTSAEDIAKTRTHVAQTAVPSYFQDTDGDFYAICEQMNEGIAQLLRQAGQRDHRQKAIAVAKICHNLLVSTAAPDLQTYNILLSGFSLWRRSKLADDVIAAFYASKVRPNEYLCRQILVYYTMQSRPDDFSRFVAKMRGVDDALTLADPAITITEAGRNRLVRVNENKVYQKVYPTPMVFAALIEGVLEFAGFDRALDVYYEMKADGWGLAIPGLIKLLGDCIRRADWEGGTYVWEEVNSIKTKVKSSHAAKAYHHMLSLCSVTGNTVAFNQVLNDVAKRGFDQKLILKAALRTIQLAQHKTDNTAPAWAADNLMIAVSGYLNDAKSLKGEADDVVLDDDAFTQHTLKGPDTSPMTKDDPVDPKEAWSSWVEHEFGERPKDPEP